MSGEAYETYATAWYEGRLVAALDHLLRYRGLREVRNLLALQERCEVQVSQAPYEGARFFCDDLEAFRWVWLDRYAALYLVDERDKTVWFVDLVLGAPVWGPARAEAL